MTDIQEEWAELRAARRRPETETVRVRVIGRHTVDEVLPGGTVELLKSRAELLVQAGNVERITQRPNVADKAGHDGPDKTG